MDRLPIVVANWKMNKTIRESVDYLHKFLPLVEGSRPAWFAIPFTALQAAKAEVGDKLILGAQNMNDASAGAFTGEIAASMLKEAGASFVILGHSERRRYFNETNECIHNKVMRAQETGLTAIVCVGESYEEREQGSTRAVLEKQLTECLKGISSFDVCMIAYEPVWAIGSGISATQEMIMEAHAMIRDIMATMTSKETIATLNILYGGSVTPASACQLANVEGIDGFLVGTASLDPETFAKIVLLQPQ